MKLVKTTHKLVISVSQDISCCTERKINCTYSQGVFYIAHEEVAPKAQTRTLSHHTHTHTICNIIHTKLLYCFWTGSMQCDIPYLVCLPVKIYYQFFWWRRWIARLVQKRGKGVLPAGCEWLLEICCWEIPHCAVKAVGRFRCSNSLKPELAFFQM